MSRGILTGEIKTRSDIPAGDMRLGYPRFSEENFPKNLKLVDDLRKMADKKGCTTAQLAINWVKAQSGRNGNPVIIPIPGATTAERVEENSKEVEITEAELEEIDELLKSFGGPAGDRYPAASSTHLEG